MGFLLLIPFFLIRFGLLSALDREAVMRAACFAPLQGREKAAYWFYQISNAAIVICPFFLPIKFFPGWFFAVGAAVYLTGVVLLVLSVAHFAAPAENGINQNGIYRYSRNPMYVAYFVFFVGCALLMQSLIFSLFVAVFQAAAHWIILSEERWCIGKFGEEYLRYMERVRRYF